MDCMNCIGDASKLKPTDLILALECSAYGRLLSMITICIMEWRADEWMSEVREILVRCYPSEHDTRSRRQRRLATGGRAVMVCT